MPDPLSITIRVASIVNGSIKALEKYNELRATFNSTYISVLSAKTQCHCVLIALNKIQDTLLYRPRLASRWTPGEDVSGRFFQSTMGACETSFAVITERLHKVINESTDKHGKATTKAKLDYMWNVSGIQAALAHASSLVAALNFLLTALNTYVWYLTSLMISANVRSESQAEMMDILTSTRHIFSKVSSNAKTIKAAQDRFSERRVSALSTSSTEDQDFEFDAFDAFVINTEIYRKAWMTAKKRKPKIQTNSSDIVRYEQRYLAKAIASFDPGQEHPEQIGFVRFETLEVSTISGEWWQAKKDTGEEGLAPSRYLTLFDAHLPLHNDIGPRRVKAVYRYVRNPDKPDELSFDKGEVLEAWDRIPGWWNAKKDSGDIGVVPSPYFILDGDAIPAEEQSVRFVRLRPPPFPKRDKELSFSTHNENNNNVAADENAPDLFSYLDSLPIAQAVLAASEEATSSDTQETATALQVMEGEHHDRQKSSDNLSSALSLESSILPCPPQSSVLEPHQIEVDSILKEPLRFVSQTEFQSMLLSFLKESVVDEKRFQIPQDKLESWINWVMSNPGDDDLNVFGMYGLEDEIRSAVLPQLIGFEGEQWGNRNTGAVLDAWVREAVMKGSIRESVQRESVRDLLILWQDSGPQRKGKVPE